MRERTELRDVLQRVFLLSTLDQLELQEVLTSYLGEVGGQEPLVVASVRHRREALDALRSVRAHLGATNGTSLTARRFDQVSAELETGWTSQRVIRAWGRWRSATEALNGIGPRETPAQRGLRRRSTGRRRTHREYFDGVRTWLATEPPSRTRKDYDYFVLEYNNDLPSGERPLVRASALRNAFGLPWADLLAVAAGSAPLPQVRKEGIEAVARSAGPAQLITSGQVALVLGVGESQVSQLVVEGRIPAPLKVLSGRRVWSYPQVNAAVGGRSSPAGPRVDPDDILGSAEVAEALGIGPDTLRSYLHKRAWRRVPRPSGSASGVHYWLRSDLVSWGSPRRKVGPGYGAGLG